MRYVYFTFGLTFVATGIIGAFLPVLPTTPFLLLAIWCFSRSNPRLEAWLLNHPKYGEPLKAWRQHGMVPRRAKISAVSLMVVSYLVVVITTNFEIWHLVLLGAVMLCSAAFIITRPSTPSRIN